MIIEENVLVVYTDGSSYSGPRRGGFGIRIIYIDDIGKEIIEDIPVFESYPGATNNQMELLACDHAIKEAKKSIYYDKVQKIIILTDSMYVCNNYKTAMFQWGLNKWITKDGNPVANAEIWKNIVKAIKKTSKKIEIRWVKGHSKDEHNRAVDKLAKQSAKSFLKGKSLNVVTVRRKMTSEKTLIGSIDMKGQRIKIRIITDQYLSAQRLNKYRYEVTSKGSKYFGRVDFIYSEIPIKAGHEYLVTFNKNSKAPRIKKVIKEIEKA